MVFLILLVVVALAIAALYTGLRRLPNRSRRWRVALGIGLVVGLARAVVASAGWYVVERTGGPLQVPAFALAMLAWPEAALFATRQVTPVPLVFYVQLSLALIAGTVALTALAAAAADMAHAADRR